MLDACRIADVAQNLMAKSLLQLLTCRIEELELTSRECIEIIAVRTHEMTEH